MEKAVRFPSGHQAALEPGQRPLCVRVRVLPHPTSHLPPQHPLPPPIPCCPAAEQHLQQNKPALCTDPAAPAPAFPGTRLAEIALISGHVQGGDSLLTIYHTTKTLEEK